MLIGRVLGWMLVLAGIVVGVKDAIVWQQTGEYPLATVGELWFSVDPASLNTLQAVVQRHLSPQIWDPGIQTLLLWPAVATFVVAGLVLMLVFRRR